MVRNIGLDIHNHPNPYTLGWINNEVEIKVTKKCNIKFYISAHFIDDVVLDVVPLDVCGVVFGISYMYMRDAIFL